VRIAKAIPARSPQKTAISFLLNLAHPRASDYLGSVISGGPGGPRLFLPEF
jgi:hypothetical protein